MMREIEVSKPCSPEAELGNLISEAVRLRGETLERRGRIPHALRRTAVRNLARADISQTVAMKMRMKMTGHKTDTVCRRYDIVSPEDLREAAIKLDAPSVKRARG